MALLRRWVPPKERARSLALVHSGLYAGSMVGLAIAPHMIAHMGWPSVFYVFGALGMGWYTWWEQQAASSPRDDAHISRGELKYIRRSMALGQQQVSLRKPCLDLSSALFSASAPCESLTRPGWLPSIVEEMP